MSDVPKTYSLGVLFIFMTSLKPGLQGESQCWRQRSYLIPNLIALFWQRSTGIKTQPNAARVNWSLPSGGRCRYVNSLIRMTPPRVYLIPFLVSPTPSNCKIFWTNWTGFLPQIAISSPPSSPQSMVDEAPDRKGRVQIQTKLESTRVPLSRHSKM